MPIIPTLGRLRQDGEVQDQLGLHSKLCLKKQTRLREKLKW
jgi:hypothetical protein